MGFLKMMMMIVIYNYDDDDDGDTNNNNKKPINRSLYLLYYALESTLSRVDLL